MTNEERACETCGTIAFLYVYALPGIPMSVGNCYECFSRNAYPLDVAEANLECIGGLELAAEWWRKSITYKDGRYLTVEEAFGE